MSDVGLIILFLFLFLLVGGVGFAAHAIWWILVILVVVAIFSVVSRR